MLLSKEVDAVPEITHPFGKRVDNVDIRLPPARSELPTLRHATGTGKRKKPENHQSLGVTVRASYLGMTSH